MESGDRLPLSMTVRLVKERRVKRTTYISCRHDGKKVLSLEYEAPAWRLFDSYLPIQNVVANRGKKGASLFDQRGVLLPLVKEILTIISLEEIREILTASENRETPETEEESLLRERIMDKKNLVHSMFATDLVNGNFSKVAKACTPIIAVGKASLTMSATQKVETEKQFFSTVRWKSDIEIESQLENLIHLRKVCRYLGRLSEDKIRQYRRLALLGEDDGNAFDTPLRGQNDSPAEEDYKYALSENIDQKEAEWHAIKCILSELIHTHFQDIVIQRKPITKKMFCELWLQKFPYQKDVGLSNLSPMKQLEEVKSSVLRHSAHWIFFPSKRSSKIRDLLRKWGLDWLKADPKHVRAGKLSAKKNAKGKQLVKRTGQPETRVNQEKQGASMGAS